MTWHSPIACGVLFESSFIFMSFSWQCQNLSLLSLTFIIDWRVATPFKCKCWTEIAPFPVKLFHAKNIWRLHSIYLHLPGMTTEKYVAKIRHGYTSVKELEREIFCIKCAKKCYSPAAFALHYDRHLLTNKTSAATSNRCDLTIKELTQAFFSLPLAKPGSFLLPRLVIFLAT